MEQLIITPTTLLELGFSPSPALPIIIETVGNNYHPGDRENAIVQLKALLDQPAAFLGDMVWNKSAIALLPKEDDTIKLKAASPYNVYGSTQIEAGAIRQMDTAVLLPVAVAGALMPDAHQGYGLPIGGVLATRNAVIPYGEGVDIGCRMCLSIYDIPGSHLKLILQNNKENCLHIQSLVPALVFMDNIKLIMRSWKIRLSRQPH